MKHGYGIYDWPDGKRFEGYWCKGFQHGEGKLIFPDKSIQIGTWKLGVLSKLKRQIDSRGIEKIFSE